MKLISLREQYPALSGQTYLNTASCGVMSRSTAHVAQQFYQELLEQGGVPRARWSEQIPLLRQEVAEWLGAHEEEVTLLPNFSIASNFVAQALSGYSQVLLLGDDYPSLTMPWVLHCDEVHYVPTEPNGSFDLNRIEQKVKALNIKVLAISHVQYTSGFCVDLEQLGKCCRDWGVISVVDATQSLGVMPINLQTMPVDILMGSGYKWMTAGFGNALLYVRNEVRDSLPAVAIGNNSWDEATQVSTKDDISFSARTLEVGHYDFSSFLAMRQAVRELQAIGAAVIAQRVIELTTYLHDNLPPTVRILSDYPAPFRSGITIIEGDETLEQRLLKQKVVTSARSRGLRISLHFYNNEADIDHLCEALTS